MSSSNPVSTEVEQLQGKISDLEKAQATLVQQLAELGLKAENALVECQELKTQKQESLGTLAAGIAHRFNNLLTGILGNLSLLKPEVAGQARASQYVTQIEQAANRIAEFCKQMLAYTGRGSFILEPVNLNRRLAGMKDLLTLSLSSKVQLQFQLHDPLPNIMADASQLRQIVVNLAANASEAMGEQGGTLIIATAEADLEADHLPKERRSPDFSPGKFVVLEVRDTGPGIPEEIRDKIFDPFFTTKFTGRGLGLSVVLGIARSHKGGVEVQTTPGQGTTFRVYFPVSRTVAAEESLPAPAGATPTVSSGTILVVDDEAFVRAVASRLLELMGFHVIQATDGQEALQIVQKAKDQIQLVLLDLTMPGLDGEKTLEQLRLLDPTLPVILMSGYSTQDVSSRFAGQEPPGFLQKPFNQETLAAQVQAALAKRKPPAENESPGTDSPAEG